MHFEKVVAGFSRYHKYTLGAELRNQSRAVVSAIVKANSQTDKLPALLGLRDRLEELMLLVRLAKEVRAFKSFKSYQYAVEEVVSVSRQNEGCVRSGPTAKWADYRAVVRLLVGHDQRQQCHQRVERELQQCQRGQQR